MAAAAHDIGRAGNHFHLQVPRGACRFHGDGKLGNRDAIGQIARHLCRRVIIMGRQWKIAMANTVQKPGTLLFTKLRALRQQAVNPRLHFSVSPLCLAFAHGGVADQIAILANPWRVIHQAYHDHARMIRHRVKRRGHVTRRQFATQMQEMLALQRAHIGKLIKITDAIQKGLAAFGIKAKITKAQRIQNRGDTSGNTLRIMRDHGGTRRPARIGARQHLAFQIIRVDINNAGDQMIAFQIKRALCLAAARLDFGNQPITQHQRAIQHRIG